VFAEPSADRLVDQILRDIGCDSPVAEEPREHLAAMPVPAAAAARTVGHLQDQISSGAFPQDPLVSDIDQLRRVRLEPPS
jgi:hypothetical protein